MQSDKSNLSTNPQSNKNFTFYVSASELDECITGDIFINGTLSSKVLGEYKQLKQEIRQKCSKEYRTHSIKKYLDDSTTLTKHCLFQAIENQSFIQYNIYILYGEVLNMFMFMQLCLFFNE
jgi:hypothetical protein